MLNDTSIQVKTDNFDGPLGLLLSLIQKEEMDIRDLDLLKVTQQYLDYLFQMNELNFDIAGDYLYLAATLILLKSKDAILETGSELLNLKEKLVEEQGPHITSEVDLIYRLEQLQHFQKMGKKIWQLPRRGEHVFVRPKINRKAMIDSILTPVKLQGLVNTMMDLMIQEQKSYTVIKKDALSIKDKLTFLKHYLDLKKETDYEELLKMDGGKNRGNMIVTFMSLLELTRLRYIDIVQPKRLGNIFINVFKSLNELDFNKVTGFDQPTALHAGEELENG